MPLPVVFKFLSDTTGLKFSEVDRGLNDMNISSQKAGQAVKSLAGIIRSGQEPVEALANSVSNMTRAFGLGVGATIAVVGVVEAIKSFVSESEKMNTVAESLNKTIDGMRQSSDNLDFSGAISQIKQITAAIEEARNKAQGEKGGILGRVGRSIAGMMGLSEYNLRAAQDAAANQKALTKDAALAALDRRIEVQNAEKAGKFVAQRLEIQRRYEAERSAAEKAGVLDRAKEKLDTLEILELRKVAMAEIEEKGKIQEQQLKEEKAQQERINEMRLRAEEKITREKEKQIEAQKKYFEDGLRGAGTILDRTRDAAERLGRKDIIREIDTRRKEEQRRSDELLINALGRPEGLRDFRSTREIETARIGQFAAIEGEVQRSETMGLFNQVDTVRAHVFKIVEILESRLGVPILKTAY